LKNDQKCAHVACGCAVAPGARHCSSYCEGAGDHLDITCQCEHAGCAASSDAGTELDALSVQPSDPSLVANLDRDPEDRTVSSDAEKMREKMMDKTLADSYPASDPPSTIPNPSDDSLG
jgi:hypothetical protein